jgi:hypothetical protein
MRAPAVVAIVFSAATALGRTGTPLEEGYRAMYNLQFDLAHRLFAQWEQAHPEDPLGPVSDAAAYLFSELDRLHILQSEFFTDDENFRKRKKLYPDPAVKDKFESALAKSRQLADRTLQHAPNDKDARFATIMRLGLHADYLALIEKRGLAALNEMKSGRMLAEQLIAQDPRYCDAYLAVGVENYMLSLKAAPVRWMLRLGGAETEKDRGIEDLRLTAEKGHYLVPYARLLLAVAALRDHDRTRARELLFGLAKEFPYNRLYAQELARIQ